MKILYISIVCSLFLSISIIGTNLPAVQGIGGSAFFMKPNSTAKIYADLTIPVLSKQNWDLKPEILAVAGDSSANPTDLTIDSRPSSFTANSHHVYVTYSITAKGSAKGVYSLFLFFCGSYPLVVGLNESGVSPTVYNKFFSAVYNCPAMSTGTPDIKLIGYSQIIPKTLSIDSNNTITVISIDKSGVPPQDPLKQFKSGIPALNVKCRDDFVHIIKAEDNSPACVKADSAEILIKRGWAQPGIIP